MVFYTRRLGCTQCGLIEPEPGKWAKGLCTICLELQSKTKTAHGSPYLEFAGKCEHCGRMFQWKSSVVRGERAFAPKFNRRFCGRACAQKSKRKLPDDTTLKKLYVDQNLATPAIARMFGISDPHTVNTALRKAGIKIRRHTKALRCIVEGCNNLVQKKRNSNGRIWGTRCSFHAEQHRHEMNRHYARRIDPERGTRKTGRKPKPARCAGCFKLHTTTRDAVACCRIDTRKAKPLPESST